MEAEAKTHRLFEKKATQLIKKNGELAMTGGEVFKQGRNMFGKKFRGVYMVDNTALSRPGYMIVNNDLSGGPGEHWVGVIIKAKTAYVYDSFARSTKTLLRPLYKKLKEKGFKVIESDRNDLEQSEDSQICGNLCLAWLYVANKMGLDKAILI